LPYVPCPVPPPIYIEPPPIQPIDREPPPAKKIDYCVVFRRDTATSPWVIDSIHRTRTAAEARRDVLYGKVAEVLYNCYP